MFYGGCRLRTIRHSISRTLFPVHKLFHGGTVTRSTPRVQGQRSTLFGEEKYPSADTTRLLISSEYEYLDRDPVHYVEFLNEQPGNRAGVAKDHALTNSDVISAYLAVRQCQTSLSHLCKNAYARVSKQAEAEGLQQVMSALAEDLLSHFPRDSDPEGFSASVISILSHASSQCPLPHQGILQLYEALVTSSDGVVPPLDTDIVQRIITAASVRHDRDISLLETLGPALLSMHSEGQGKRITSTQVAYDLLMKLIVEGEASYPRALRLFEDLLKANRIPKQALVLAGEARSFQTVIVTVLVKSCVWYGWHEKASDILLEILRNPQWPYAQGITETDVQMTASLALEVLRSLLPTRSKNIVQISRTLILLLLPITSDEMSSPQPPPLEIPEDLLFAFYDSCFTCQLPAPAAHVYRHLQSPEIRQHHDYLPPRRGALIWLLDHFASPGISPNEEQRQDLEGHLYLARTMIDDIVRQKHPVALRNRPRLISLAAAAGFGMYARQLWEMYTTKDDQNRDIVRGSAHVLVPLVRLFVWLQEHSGSRRKRGKWVDTSRAKDLHEGEGEAADSSSRDYRGFAEQVMASYIETKMPLAMASQYDLNALARAQLLLGYLPEGIHTLSLIMERGDPPQITDINVVLATVAQYSPSRATQMIQHMLSRGVQPDGSTFSTVLHEALRVHDAATVEKLVFLARESGYGSLTQKGIAAFVRYAMTFEYTENKEERMEQQCKIREVMNAIETIMQTHRKSNTNLNNHVKSHAISMSVGIICVKGSLKAMEPEIAFRFWRLLVKDRMLWDDREHKDLRAWIARSVRYAWRVQRLSTNQAASMLEVLRASGVEADGPRVGKKLGL